MDMANLQRYDYRVGDPRRDVPILVCDEHGGYCKFEEAVEASSDSLQHLKAEIAAFANELSGYYIKDCDVANVKDLVERMRQLSAV